MPLAHSEQQRLRDIDRQIVALCRDVKVLGPLSWPLEAKQEFLAGWHRGQPKMPLVRYAKTDHSARRTALEALLPQLDKSDALQRYLHDTAESYVLICSLLESVGDDKAVSELSIRIYGRPGDSLSGGRVTSLDAARHFVDISRSYYAQSQLRDADYFLSAEQVQAELQRRITEVIDGHDIAVVVDPQLMSKAAAGATRVRLRGGTCFSQYDVDQLLHHEVFVHSLTALNGRCQPNFGCFGLGAPRTTGPQEGLATFAELITGSIDIGRMSRIALRVLAIDMALSGADFIDVFRFFLDSGQSDSESCNSAMRIFRGVSPRGGAAFTKDSVYLHSLLEMHTFFRWALQHQRLELTHHFAAGRMTIDDALRLEPYFRDGTVAGPRYLPPWMRRRSGLAGYLAFSVFANQIRINDLDANHQFERLDQLCG